MMISIVVFIAAIKEIVYDDFLKKGTPEVADFIYTILPCLFYLTNLPGSMANELFLTVRQAPEE